jgi:hypothetical protein
MIQNDLHPFCAVVSFTVSFTVSITVSILVSIPALVG